MKIIHLISILLILILLTLNSNNNNNVVLGDYLSKDTGEFPFEDIAEYIPVYTAYNSIVPDNWKLKNQDYLTLVRGAICSIPVVGAMVDSVFSIFFGKLFPGTEKYVTKEVFEERMNNLADDMKGYTTKYVDAEIEKATIKSIIRTCAMEFENIRGSSLNYKNLIEVWNYQIGKNEVADSQLKDNLPVVYWLFLTKIEDSLREFSAPDIIHRVGKVYLETSFYYISMLRDGHYNGISMGLSTELVEGIPGKPSKIITFADKTKEHSFSALNNIASIFANLIIDKSSGSTCETGADKKGVVSKDCPKIYKGLPNWSLVVSRILYSNLVTYNSKILMLKGNTLPNSDPYNTSLTVNINITNSINIIDFLTMGKEIVSGHYYPKPYESYGQVCDFVTGMIGFHFTDGSFGKTFLLDKTLDLSKEGLDTLPLMAYGPYGQSRSNFFTNIIFDKNTNKKVKFRIYFSDPVYWLDPEYGRNEIRLLIGYVKKGALNIHQNVGTILSPKRFWLSGTTHANGITTSDNPSGWTVTRVTKSFNRDIRSHYYLESPNFNFGGETNVYFQLNPVDYFSLNLLSLEIITST